jgi:HEPN domain-containing protein
MTKVTYWLEICAEDLLTAKYLLKGKRLLHCLFFCHQVIEKAFKAAVAFHTDNAAPKVHDLQKLAKASHLFDELTEEQFKLIDVLRPFQIEARYPAHKEKLAQSLNYKYCSGIVSRTEALLCWIKQQLEIWQDNTREK